MIDILLRKLWFLYDEMKKDASCRVRMMEEYHLSDGDVERIVRDVDKSMQELGIEVE